MLDCRKILEKHIAKAKSRDFKKELVAFDTETDEFYGPLTAVSVAQRGGATAHVPEWGPPKFPEDPIIAWHGGQYDYRVAYREGWTIPETIYLDTQAASHLLDENSFNGLKPTAKRYLPQVDERWYEQGWDKSLKGEELLHYARLDALYTRAIALHMWPMLEEEGLLDVWLRVESPMSLIAGEMEERGIQIDRAALEARWNEAGKNTEELKYYMRNLHPAGPWACQREGCEEGIYHFDMGSVSKVRECRQCDGTGLNLVVFNSPDQMTDILFNQLDLDPVAFTDKGNPKTGEEFLRKIIDQTDDPDKAAFVYRLMEYREWSKLYSSFYTPYMESGATEMHPHFKPWGTVTGRWSCENPNMQQVPKNVRTLFVPREGYKFLSVDYVQLELYLMAAFAGEEKILEAYENDYDLHQRTADVAGVSRHVGKTINFSLAYGLSATTLASRLNISKDCAGEIIAAVTGGYSALFGYFESVKDQARHDGFVTTLFHRRRRLPEILSRDFKKRGHAERQAVNSVIQGTAADIIKAVTIDCKLNVPEALPILQVHDELDFEVPIEHGEEIREAIRERFENIVSGFGLYPKCEPRLLDRWS